MDCKGNAKKDIKFELKNVFNLNQVSKTYENGHK